MLTSEHHQENINTHTRNEARLYCFTPAHCTQFTGSQESILQLDLDTEEGESLPHNIADDIPRVHSVSPTFIIQLDNEVGSDSHRLQMSISNARVYVAPAPIIRRIGDLAAALRPAGDACCQCCRYQRQQSELQVH